MFQESVTDQCPPRSWRRGANCQKAQGGPEPNILLDFVLRKYFYSYLYIEIYPLLTEKMFFIYWVLTENHHSIIFYLVCMHYASEFIYYTSDWFNHLVWRFGCRSLQTHCLATSVICAGWAAISRPAKILISVSRVLAQLTFGHTLEACPPDIPPPFWGLALQCTVEPPKKRFALQGGSTPKYYNFEKCSNLHFDKTRNGFSIIMFLLCPSQVGGRRWYYFFFEEEKNFVSVIPMKLKSHL